MKQTECHSMLCSVKKRAASGQRARYQTPHLYEALWGCCTSIIISCVSFQWELLRPSGQRYNLDSSRESAWSYGVCIRACLAKASFCISVTAVPIPWKKISHAFPRESCSRLEKDNSTLRPNYSQLHWLLKRISRKLLCQQRASA